MSIMRWASEFASGMRSEVVSFSVRRVPERPGVIEFEVKWLEGGHLMSHSRRTTEGQLAAASFALATEVAKVMDSDIKERQVKK